VVYFNAEVSIRINHLFYIIYRVWSV